MDFCKVASGWENELWGQAAWLAWSWLQSGTGISRTWISSFSPFLSNKVKTPLVGFLKQPKFEQGLGWDSITITPSEHYLFEVNLLTSLQKYSPISIPWARVAVSGIFVVIFKYAYLKVSKRKTQRKQNLFFINDWRIRYSCDIIYKVFLPAACDKSPCSSPCAEM